jgi:hypothetical protein
LVCQEEATYRQGTDIRTETRIVHEQRIFQGESIRIDPGAPLELRETLRVPEDAMHSFQSSYNAVHWTLVVKGQPESWPAFERSFPVIVHPPGGETP